MGRHSRRGPAPKDETAGAGPTGRRRASETGPAEGEEGAPRAVPPGMPGHGESPLSYGTPPRGVPRLPDGMPARGVPGRAEAIPPRGAPRYADGTPPRGVPGYGDGTPPRGVPGYGDGTPPRGVPRHIDRTPPRGVPQAGGTPAQGTPRFPDGTPARGARQVRGGHPEQREAGGGWGELKGAPAPSGGAGIPRSRPTSRRGGPRAPRQDYLDAFDADGGADGGFPSRAPGAGAEPHASGSRRDDAPAGGTPGGGGPRNGEPARGSGGGSGRGRTFTGVAAAAVTTVLAVVVAGQVGEGPDHGSVASQAATGQARGAHGPASRGDGRPTPSGSPSAVPLTYYQKMAMTYPLSASLDGPGTFDAVPGIDKAPGAGQKYTYRVDVEQGLGLDGELFAQAVQRTLNDDRSWAHNGGRTFERIHSGEPDFVITLASPGTTADWCAKSGLDTTVDNVSCDSAATERVMINAYRWAQGSETYGDDIHAYRQMLINHEVGHRLGYSHVTCDKDGDLAPVMQQQTKFLEHDGIRCKPNPWPYPAS
ncbi:DUF3152 domain-containing protein [Streptomyces glaucescens]|uniref:DUF3152 domain-containing protein n=1 Tax=Streptomyces glaucescens TaxID=1907 RepID=UPI0005B8FDAB|nr:DUF3152 domain-containing protein [Streptomyces glaucescens]